MSLRRRLSAGFGASAYSRVVSIVGQLALVPIFVHCWGTATYGAWLTLTSLASYLSQTSLGLIPAARSEMSMAFGRGDRAAVLETFQTGLIFVAVTSTIGGLAFVGVLTATPVLARFNILPIHHDAALLIVQVLTLQIVLSLQSGVLYGGLSALGHYGAALALDSTRQLFDFLGVVLLALLFRARPETVVLTYAVTSSFFLGVAVFLLHRIAPWLKVGTGHASARALRRLWQPMVGGLALSFGYNGLVIQAPRLILAATAGPLSVAVYSVATMLLRLVRMLQEMVVFPIGIEVGRAFGVGDFPLANRLFLVTSSLSFWMILIAAPIFVVAGPWLITLWTAGGVTPGRPLIAVLVLAGAFGSLSMPVQQALLSINRLMAASLMLVVVSAPALLLSALLARHLGALGMGLGICALEGAFLAAVLVMLARYFHLSLAEYIRAHIVPPVGLLLAETRHILARLAPRAGT